MLADRTSTVFSLIRANLRAIVICVLLVIGIEAANTLVDVPLLQRNRDIFSTATLGLVGTAFSIFLVLRLTFENSSAKRNCLTRCGHATES